MFFHQLKKLIVKFKSIIQRGLIFFIIFYFFLLNSLSAEVLDKIPSAETFLFSGIGFGILGFFLCCIRTWLGIPTLAITLFFAISFQMDVVNDTSMRHAILGEAGYSYFILNYLGILISILGHALGIWLKKRKTNL